MSNNLVMRFISTRDPEFLEARRFRYAVLFEPLEIPESRIEWEDDLPGTHHLVIFNRGDLAAYGRVVMRGDEGQIRFLSVSPKYRGLGIGSALLDALIDKAREEGAQSVFLNARLNTYGLYHSRGFQPVGAILNGEGTHIPHQRMALSLDAAEGAQPGA